MATHPAFIGHGTFCYLPDVTMRHYRNYPSGLGSGILDRVRRFLNLAAPPTAIDPAGFVRAVKDMNMSNVWVRLFGLEGVMNPAPTRQLVDALKSAGINVAGWGYCHGKDWEAELDHAINQSRTYGLTAFVADIEPGRLLGGTKSRWRVNDFVRLVDGLVDEFSRDNLGISTWPVLKIQDSAEFPSIDLMRHVADRVAMFAPQAYWMGYPKQVHYDATGFKETQYPRDDPSSFVRLVVDSWRALGFDQHLVVTGQAYWGEGGPSRSILERKLREFTTSYVEWHKIIGFNWWHAGNELAMSRPMIDALVSAKLGQKPFATPRELVV
ncbi:hypothetical protein [Bradyrhizobium neotropicale]|uniref:hypothetical protein n=1 Tax=Bradyrhizobium neotropicale TaxID=1497615 RepID=UPI001AD7DC9C|nr:hypothetical protein [Bradyrhizobium neotropicale]MBO4223476.1 hypothetical protein [Bradyrhizobium neotropicale]